jgi:hypothetical protein
LEPVAVELADKGRNCPESESKEVKEDAPSEDVQASSNLADEVEGICVAGTMPRPDKTESS